MMKMLAGGRGMPNLEALMSGQRTKR
jgi:hypothetical protein